MKRMKRFAAFLLLAVMLANTIPFYAFAAGGEMTLTVSTVSGTPGEEVTVTVDVSDNPGIASLVFDVNYDSMLTLVDVQFSEAFGNLVTTPTPYTNPQTITLISPFADITANGTLATLTFAISESAADEYEAEVSITCKDNDIYNTQKELVKTKAVNGKVCVFRGIPGDVNGDKAVNTKDAVLLFRYVAGWDVTVDPLAVDCNGDGIVDTWDAIELFRYTADWPDIKLYYATMCAHDLEYVEANEATCTEDGNVAHWHCSACNGNYSDAKGKEVLNAVIVDAIGHDMQYNAEKAPTCTESGNVEYWHCANCELNFADEDGDTVIGVTSISETGHDLTKFSEQSATCTESGNVTYWFCETCEKNFKDEDATEEIGDVTVSASGHKLSFVEAKEATHISDGNVAYWYCTACKCCFTDDSASTEIADVVIPATGHGEMLEHVEAKESTVYEKGNDEYWYCPECDKYYKDAEAKNEYIGGKPEIAIIESYSITFVDDKNLYDGENYYKILVPITEDYYIGDDRKPPLVLGYKFGGWYTEDADINAKPKTFISAMPSGTNIVLEAKWNAEQFSITYNDAPANDNNPTTYTIEDTIIIADPQWEALKFDSWTVNSGTVVQTIVDGKTITKIEKGTTGNIELTANWRSMENLVVPGDTSKPFEIYFDDDNYQYIYVYNIGTIENVVIKTIKGPDYKYEKENLSWVIGESFGFEESTSKEVGTTVIETITTSQQWETASSWITGHENESHHNFSAEIGKDVENKLQWKVGTELGWSSTDSESYEYTTSESNSFDKETGKENTVSTMMGYSTTYSSDIEFSRTVGEGWPAGDYRYVVTGKVYVFAIITYDIIEGTYYYNLYSVMDDTTKSMILYNPTSDMDVNIVGNPGFPVVAPEDDITTLIDSHYYVRYDANGGIGTMMTEVRAVDEEFTLPESAFKRDGYVFTGWSLTPDGKYDYTDKEDVINIANSKEIVSLYAVWERIPYKVSWNTGFGYTITVMRTESATGATIGKLESGDTVYWGDVLSIEYTAKTGYELGLCGENEIVITDNNIDSQMIFASATPDSYTVIYDANGGSGHVADTLLTYDQSGILRENGFSRTGWVFKGWSADPKATEADYTVKQGINNELYQYVKNDTVTLYAVWALITSSSGTWLPDSEEMLDGADISNGKAITIKVTDYFDTKYLSDNGKNIKITVTFHYRVDKENQKAVPSIELFAAEKGSSPTGLDLDEVGAKSLKYQEQETEKGAEDNITCTHSVGPSTFTQRNYLIVFFDAEVKNAFLTNDWWVSNIRITLEVK